MLRTKLPPAWSPQPSPLARTQTAIIANLSPADASFSETLSTLKFAQRAKLIKTRAIVNEVRPPAPPLPSRTKWTRRVPHPVLIGHAASLTPY